MQDSSFLGKNINNIVLSIAQISLEMSIPMWIQFFQQNILNDLFFLFFFPSFYRLLDQCTPFYNAIFLKSFSVVWIINYPMLIKLLLPLQVIWLVRISRPSIFQHLMFRLSITLISKQNRQRGLWTMAPCLSTLRKAFPFTFPFRFFLVC